MAYSMTGFGRGEKVFDTRKYSIEIKSVNSRFCDISIRMPRIFNYLDGDIRRVITDRLLRGKIDVFVKKHKLGAPVINTGNPGEYTIKQLAEETLRQIPESKSKLIYKPLPSDDPKRRKPDITLAKKLLNWEPKVPLKVGLAKTIEYFRALQG